MDIPITLNYVTKKNLIDIVRLNPSYHVRVYKLMKKHNIKMSENSNGIFFDLNDVPGDVIRELVLIMSPHAKL